MTDYDSVVFPDENGILTRNLNYYWVILLSSDGVYRSELIYYGLRTNYPTIYANTLGGKIPQEVIMEGWETGEESTKTILHTEDFGNAFDPSLSTISAPYIYQGNDGDSVSVRITHSGTGDIYWIPYSENQSFNYYYPYNWETYNFADGIKQIDAPWMTYSWIFWINGDETYAPFLGVFSMYGDD